MSKLQRMLHDFVPGQTPPATPRTPRTPRALNIFTGSPQLAPMVVHAVADDEEDLVPRTSDGVLRDGSAESIKKSSACGIRESASTQIFALKEGWNFAEVFGMEDRQDRIMKIQASAQIQFEGSQMFNEIEFFERDWLSRTLVARPDNPGRIAWEFSGVLFASYDMIALPLLFIFEIKDNDWTFTMDWIMRVFWTLNIWVSLTTGFVKGDIVTMEISKIVLRYTKTWLIIDFVTVLPDWFFYFLQAGNARAISKLIRTIRVLRIARLLRLVKLRDAWTYVYDLIDSEQLGIFINVFGMVLVLMLVNHYNACAWFWVGRQQQSGKNWISTFGFSKDDGVGWFEQYITSYHWAITQFTPSSMHVQPQAPTERVYAVMCVILGLVGFSYLVGSITSSLGRLRSLKEDRIKNFWNLRKFLKKNHVPPLLASRVRKYVENRWEHQESSKKLSTAKFVGLLSDNLRSELEYVLHWTALRVHPLFDEMNRNSIITIQRLTHHGIAHCSLAPQDFMFRAGEEALHMSILTKGAMDYQRVHGKKTHPEHVSEREDWISEQAIWISRWHHLGDLAAITDSELVTITPCRLKEVCTLNALALWMVCVYAQGYVHWLNDRDRSTHSDIAQGEDVTDELRDIVKVYDDYVHDIKDGQDIDNGAVEESLKRAVSQHRKSRPNMDELNGGIP